MRKTLLVVAMLAGCVLPAFGQNGRVELNGFGRYTSFTRDRPIDAALGIGGGLGVYIFDRLRLAADASYTKSDSVKFTPYHVRLIYEQPVGKALRLMIGSGYVKSNYTNSRPSDQGIADMAGIKVKLSPPLSFFAQFTHDWMAAGMNDPIAMYQTTPSGIIVTFNTYNDINLGGEAGLAFRFGAKPEAAAPVAVAPPPPPPQQQPVQPPPPPPQAQQPPPPPPQPQPLQEKPVEPKYVTLTPIYFDVSSSEIRGDQMPTAQAMVGILKGNGDAQITITGYADERGTDESNLKLGMRRAESIKSYLVDNGIAGSRLTTATKGESDPADPGHDEAAWAKNRRAEFKVKGDVPLKLVSQN